MGYYSSPNYDRGTLYLNTQDPNKSPMCLQNYAVTLYSENPNPNPLAQARGIFTISFKTAAQETSSIELIDSGKTEFKANSVQKRFISLKKPIESTSSITSATVSYTKITDILISWLYTAKWSFKY